MRFLPVIAALLLAAAPAAAQVRTGIDRPQDEKFATLKDLSAKHGIDAAIDGVAIDDSKDQASGLPVIGVYGATDA